MPTLLQKIRKSACMTPVLLGLVGGAMALPMMAHAQQVQQPAPSKIAGIDTVARQGILVDVETGAVLWERNSAHRLYPASMTKIMTAYVVFDQLSNGTLNLNDTFLVSRKAWKKGGSKMFLRQGERVSVQNLLQGLIVQSGNDAAITLAEGISGSEEQFAVLMNQIAQKLQMNGTNFVNASGWPDDNHYSTAQDLYRLGYAMITQFPQYYDMYAQRSFTYAGIKQQNRNPLLYANIGADGIKTGHTEISGYGLIGSATRNGRRVIGVLHGMDSKSARAKESIRIIRWGVDNFANYTLFQAGDIVDEMAVWLGKDPTVSLYLKDDIKLTLPKNNTKGLQVKLHMNEPLPAPITKGQEMGKLVVSLNGENKAVYPVYASNDVAKLGSIGRLWATFETLLWGER